MTGSPCARAIKRLIDVGAASAGLLLLAPSIALIAVAVRVSMGPPVLFRQARPGLHGRPFQLVQFRSMTSASGPDGSELPEHERVIRLGALLRRYSLDELPELWNVLKGDMCVVGLRPLLMEYLPRFSPEQARRHEVRPGITGLARVRGRHELPWDERLRLDVWYVDDWSIKGDLRTLGVMLGGDERAEGPGFWGPDRPAEMTGREASHMHRCTPPMACSPRAGALPRESA